MEPLLSVETILNQIGRTPIVRLDRIDRLTCARRPLFGKCEHLNPGGSVKDRIAKAIVEAAETSGDLKLGMTIVEATAGNTGIGLALVAAAKNYKLVFVMPQKMSVEKQVALRALGAHVIVTPNAPRKDPDNFRNRAAQLARDNGWFCTDQFNHPANADIHETTTGPEIREQCGGHVGAFVCGVGTGGTITGVGRFLKRHCPGVKIVLADPVGSRLAHFVDQKNPDIDAPYQVEGIGGSEVTGNLDLSVIDWAERVSDEESFATTRLLIRKGMLVGGSSGTTVAAAMRVAQREDVDGPVISLLADSWDRYYSQPWMTTNQ